jgi:hypothetical protein
VDHAVEKEQEKGGDVKYSEMKSRIELIDFHQNRIDRCDKILEYPDDGGIDITTPRSNPTLRIDGGSDPELLRQIRSSAREVVERLKKESEIAIQSIEEDKPDRISIDRESFSWIWAHGLKAGVDPISKPMAQEDKDWIEFIERKVFP